MENRGGLFIFGMDFTSKGFSLAENLYQKWENICQENITVQDPSRFVDAVSDQFRKICDEVADDWLNPFSDGCVEGPVSDLSLELDVIAEICKKSKTGYDERPVDEGSFISISSEDSMSVSPLPAIGQDVRKEACEMPNKKVTMVPQDIVVCNCSNETSEDQEEISPNFVNHPGHPSSADGVLLSEYPENIGGKGFGPSNFSFPTEENGTSASEEGVSSVQSIADVYEEKSNSTDADIQENDEFEDVKLEDLFEENKEVDCWEDAEEYQVTLLSHQAVKKRSCKKKLKDIFNSNLYSPKKCNNIGANFYGAIDTVLEMRDKATASSVSSRGLESRDLSTTGSCEHDWELI